MKFGGQVVRLGIMQIGQAIVDFDAHQINGPAGNYSVEPLVMQVLSVLVKNAGQVVTRESLIDEVWGVGYGGDERLSRAISLLRKSLGETRGKHNFIQTIPRSGYKLTLNVDPAEQDNTSEVSDMLASATATLPTSSSVPARTNNGLIAIISTAVIALFALVYFGVKSISPTPEPPLVIIMDSAHPARVYDEQVMSDGGTNADILSDILGNLPIRTQKELISPSWHRYEAIKQFNPDLIVIHYSGFKQADSSGGRPQLRLLIEFFLDTDTKFLIYTRADNAWLDSHMNKVLKDIYPQNSELRERIDIFPLLEYGEPYWKDQASAQGVKLKIKHMLNLQ